MDAAAIAQRLESARLRENASERLAAYENLILELLDANQAAEARSVLQAAQADDHIAQAAHSMERLALMQGQVALQEFQIEEAITLLDPVCRDASPFLPFALLARLQLTLAEAYFSINHYDQCREAAARVLSAAGDDAAARAVALTWMGAASAQLSEYQTALEQLHESQRLLDTAKRPALKLRPMNYIAVVFEELGEDREARAWYEKALSLLQAHPDSRMEIRICSNYGEFLARHGEIRQASALLERAAQAAEHTGDHSLRAWCFWALANIALNAGNIGDAERLYDIALEEVKQGHAERTRAEVLTGAGILQARKNNYKAALKLLHQGLKHAKHARVNREIYKTHHALAEVHEQFGEHSKALEHFREFHRIRTEVYDEVARAKVRNVLARFELEQARQEQELNHIRNVELKNAYQQLRELHAELAEKNRLLEEYSIRDPLTGVYNRRYLDRKLAAEFERARRYGTPLSVALCDLDDFKAINDQLSHATGDEVLRAVADLLQEQLRQSDIVARYGGEEFVLVFPETGLESAVMACEKIRVSVEQQDWSDIHPRLHITLSVGVAEDGRLVHWERLLAAADAQLYQAKRSGKNRVFS